MPKHIIAIRRSHIIAFLSIADVVLRIATPTNTSLVYSYRIPTHLHTHAEPGALVWVPLRRRLVQGIILTTYERACKSQSAEALRDIAAFVDARISLTPIALQLASWLAHTYALPHHEALDLFLPPGITSDSTMSWRITPAGQAINLGDIPEPERSVLYYLYRHHQVSEHDLVTAMNLRAAALRTTCAMLHERGLIEPTHEIISPAVRPHMEETARLALAPETIMNRVESLRRAPRQRAVLDWFLAHMPSNPADEMPWVPTHQIISDTGATRAILCRLAEKGIIELAHRERRRNPIADIPATPDSVPPLSEQQTHVWRPIAAALESSHMMTSPPVFVLHGVTGSGKTEIYLRAIARTIRHGKQAMMLVPEIALTTQLVRRFVARLGHDIALLHSGLSPGERYDEWRRVRQGTAPIIIGSRSAIFAPCSNLGLIILDEEHEPAYKQDERSPRYHARTVALQLAKLTGSVVILGSATPSLESYHMARSGTWTLLELHERLAPTMRPDGVPQPSVLPLPPVRLIDMRHELQQGNHSLMSHPLQQALAEVLAQEQQAMLFLNRRGAATFVMCRDCGHVLLCPACHTSLVLHTTSSTNNTPTSPLLRCHTCGYHMLVPVCCSHCLSPRIKSFGVGTQQVEHEVQRLFPHARTLRWDRDSTRHKGDHDRIFTAFLNHNADILIGTQMIAKGLDLPLVTLVGVITADTGLHLPDFRSSERTFQLLTQVAGRAGRRTRGARVIIQTYTPDHYAIRAAQNHDYMAFYREEIAFRRQMRYPPFSTLIRFLYHHTNLHATERAAYHMAERIMTHLTEYGIVGWDVIGPAPAIIPRQRGRYRWHLLLRIPPHADSETTIPRFLHTLAPAPGWIIDRDPVSML